MSAMARALVLGGTSFVGPALIDSARAAGLDVTVANRGTTPVHRPDVESVVADRLDDLSLSALAANGPWDFVFDAWSTAPSVVTRTARALAAVTGRWGYISTRSVYDSPGALANESWPTVEADPDADSTTYPQDKRGAEIGLIRELGHDRVTITRPGLILGPRENIGRLTWWLQRTARGGRMAVPLHPHTKWQYIDVRDLADVTIDLTIRGYAGAVDTVSQPGMLTTELLLAECVRLTGVAPEHIWLEPDVFERAGINAWSHIPGWLPDGELNDSLHGSDVSLALSLGMTLRPFSATARDQWDWMQSCDGGFHNAPVVSRLGFSAEKESELLDSHGQ